MDSSSTLSEGDVGWEEGRLDWHRAWVWFVGGEGRKLVLRFV